MLFEEGPKFGRGDFRMKAGRDPEEMKRVVDGGVGVV